MSNGLEIVDHSEDGSIDQQSVDLDTLDNFVQIPEGKIPLFGE